MEILKDTVMGILLIATIFLCFIIPIVIFVNFPFLILVIIVLYIAYVVGNEWRNK